MSAARPITKAFQWDLARQVERLDFLLKWLPRYAEWGYEELYLHIEDAVEYPSLPEVARSDAYSYRQFAQLVEAATAAGIRVVPIVNLLGHTQYLIKTPELRDLNELREAAGHPLARGQVCPLHPRTLETAGKLLRDMAPFCTAGKVHVGLDESFHLGRCPRCRADVSRRGLAAHFAGHVEQLHQRTAGLGLRMGMWADMLALLPAAIPLLPRDVIAYDWYYYPFARRPRVELRNFAEADLAAPLRARGIEYWGCPMNGAFRYEPLPVFGERLANLLSWWTRCRRVGAGGFLVTSWEANRLAIELTMAVDAAAASLWLDPQVDDPGEMLAKGFARVFGGTHTGLRSPSAGRRVVPASDGGWRRLARAALAGDKYAFAGYHRWQINDRWDACLGRDGVAPCENELNAVQGICRSLLKGDSVAQASFPWPRNHGQDARATQGLRLRAGATRRSPPALAASLAFRTYLAQRNVFVRRAAAAVFQLRREIVRGEELVHWPEDGGRAEPLGPPIERTARPARRSLGRGGRSVPTRLAVVRSSMIQLRAEAFAFTAALRRGRAAAREMWRRSRDPRVRGPNELMIERDAGRLRDWWKWLGRVERNPDIVWRATPMCGAWQLMFTVHHFAPALQKVVVEQRQADGTWVELFGLHTIAFRAAAAKPRTRICREFSVPIAAGCDEAGAGLRGPGSIALRLAVRGIGQVAVGNVELTDGVVALHPRGWPPGRRRIIGRPAPRRGFPKAEFEQNAGAVLIASWQGAPGRRRPCR